MDDEANRVLRELSVTGARIEAKLDALGQRVDDHMAEDNRSFNLLRGEATGLRDSVNMQLEEHARSRNTRLDAQDKTLKSIMEIVDRSKGAWWMLSMMGVVVAAVVGLILAFLRIWWKA